MEAVSGTENGSTPMEVEAVQNEDHTVHHLFIKGCTLQGKHKGKMTTYIQGLCMALQLGEVEISERMDLGALQVKFNCSKAAQCVKNITIEIDEEKYCPASSTAHEPQDIQPNTSGGSLDQPTQGLHSAMKSASPGRGALGWSNVTETAHQEHQHIGRSEASPPSTAYGQGVNGRSNSPWLGNTSSLFELPMPMAVQLDLAALGPALRGKVLDLIGLCNLNFGIPINGKVTFEGVFEDVARFHQALNDLRNNIPGKQNSDQVVNAAEGTRAAEIQSPEGKPSIAEAQDANQLRLSLFHYDYLNKVWADQVLALQQHYNVDLLAEVVLKLQLKEQQDQSKVKEALAALTKSIQPLLTDLGRVPVVVPESDRPNVARAFRHVQTKNLLCCLTELEDGFAITGPRSHLEQVKDELMDYLKSSSRPRATLRIENEMTAVMTEMEMPRFHWDLIENMFKDELKSVCSKYQVQMEPDVQSVKEGVRILVKNQGANQDLSANALQAFILLYQKVVTSHVTRAVKSQHSNCVKFLQYEMRLNHPSVRIMHTDGGGLCLFGLLHHVELAVRDIEQCLGKKVFVRSVSEVGGGISQSGTSVSSQRNTEGANGGNDISQSGTSVSSQRNTEAASGGSDISQSGTSVSSQRNTEGANGGNDISQSGTSVSSQRNTEGASGGNDEENTCSICLYPFKDKMTTECKHSFCKGCWKQAIAMTPQCPICKKNYGNVIGNQPDGKMTIHNSTLSLPGFEWCGMIVIDYNFPDGTQSKKHSHPGRPYWGTNRKAYLPDNAEGREVLRLLWKAFDQKLIFTVGTSRTTGMKDVVTWNDIHHKTNIHGGPTQFGYPDSNYLKRVRDELRANGIE